MTSTSGSDHGFFDKIASSSSKPTLPPDAPTKVVLVEVGPKAQIVADTIKDVLGISISEADALQPALPLVLYRNIPREKAETVRRKLELAGASVELRVGD